MQILFAAPFLLAAGLVFTVLSLIPPARRWGIPIPTGILATGPGFIVGVIVIGLSRELLKFSTDSFRLIILGAAPLAIICGLVTGVVARLIASLLSPFLLRASVLLAAFCSYFVVVVSTEIAIHVWLSHSTPSHSAERGMFMFCAALLISSLGAWFIGKASEDFRPRYLRLPWGAPYYLRARAQRGSMEKLKAILDRVPDVPPDPEDRL
jgi:hypothetical protein